jgi:peptidoglycan hydrolase-like protein with peptidoglycan-binding domain
VTRRLLRIGVTLAAVAVVGGGGWWVAQSGALAGGAAAASPDATTGTDRATAAVERRTLTITEELDATLGFDGAYAVLGGLPGTLTSTAPIGSVVTNGKRLYEVDGRHRAYLMYGTRPAWRTLEPGMSNGADVRQLENNLKALGFTRRGDKINTHWDSKTTAAVKRWQKATGQKADGTIDLGEVVFLPEAIRITEVVAAPGTSVGPGGPILNGTSNRRVVSLDLDASERDLLAPETAVDIELPDKTTVSGRVAEIGRIAESSSDQQGGSTTTLPVTIVLDDPAAGGDLDAAPVTVTVVRSTRENVLTVPVSALIALIEGGYAVEVVDDAAAASGSPAPSGSASVAGAATHLVRVEPGLFDRGVVEITADLEPGTLVVVPS